MDIPRWLVYVLGVISGALLMLAVGPASDAFWEAAYWARRICLVVGAVVLVGGLAAGAVYLFMQSHPS